MFNIASTVDGRSEAFLEKSFARNCNHANASAALERFQPEFWVEHFRRNRLDRPEPHWDAPITLQPDVALLLVRSLEQYQLGDGGGPASLIAWNSEKFRCATKESQQLVDLWFEEEKEHSRLLAGAVGRFGGHPITGHWSFSAFCWCRKWFGVDFELVVLLLTEIVSTVYYRLMQRHGEDEPLRAMCSLILRDEAGHIAFHRARMAWDARQGTASWGRIWELCFRSLGFAAATMLWVNHAKAICALGASTPEFYREVHLELNRFVGKLREEAGLGSSRDLRPAHPGVCANDPVA